MSVFFILQSQSPCDWKSPITLFTACEADQSIVGDGTCDAEAATWECDEYDGGDCIGNVDWFRYLGKSWFHGVLKDSWKCWKNRNCALFREINLCIDAFIDTLCKHLKTFLSFYKFREISWRKINCDILQLSNFFVKSSYKVVNSLTGWFHGNFTKTCEKTCKILNCIVSYMKNISWKRLANWFCTTCIDFT